MSNSGLKMRYYTFRDNPPRLQYTKTTTVQEGQQGGQKVGGHFSRTTTKSTSPVSHKPPISPRRSLENLLAPSNKDRNNNVGASRSKLNATRSDSKFSRKYGSKSEPKLDRHACGNTCSLTVYFYSPPNSSRAAAADVVTSSKRRPTSSNNNNSSGATSAGADNVDNGISPISSNGPITTRLSPAAMLGYYAISPTSSTTNLATKTTHAHKLTPTPISAPFNTPKPNINSAVSSLPTKTVSRLAISPPATTERNSPNDFNRFLSDLLKTSDTSPISAKSKSTDSLLDLEPAPVQKRERTSRGLSRSQPVLARKPKPAQPASDTSRPISSKPPPTYLGTSIKPSPLSSSILSKWSKKSSQPEPGLPHLTSLASKPSPISSRNNPPTSGVDKPVSSNWYQSTAKLSLSLPRPSARPISRPVSSYYPAAPTSPTSPTSSHQFIYSSRTTAVSLPHLSPTAPHPPPISSQYRGYSSRTPLTSPLSSYISATPILYNPPTSPLSPVVVTSPTSASRRVRRAISPRRPLATRSGRQVSAPCSFLTKTCQRWGDIPGGGGSKVLIARHSSSAATSASFSKAAKYKVPRDRDSKWDYTSGSESRVSAESSLEVS